MAREEGVIQRSLLANEGLLYRPILERGIRRLSLFQLDGFVVAYEGRKRRRSRVGLECTAISCRQPQLLVDDSNEAGGGGMWNKHLQGRGYRENHIPRHKDTPGSGKKVAAGCCPE